MPADGYLRRVLADGALPFRYRGSVRALLGEPDGPGLLRATLPAPQPQLSYQRLAWTGEIELPDDVLTMARRPLDWPAGDRRPGGDRARGTAADGMSHGMPDEILDPATGHPPAVARRAAVSETGPQPETAASPSAVVEVGPPAIPGPAAGTPAGSAHAARPPVTEPARQMTTEPTQTSVTGRPAPGTTCRPPGGRGVWARQAGDRFHSART